MRFLFAAALSLVCLSHSVNAQGLGECDFGFEIDRQSSAFQAMVVDGEQKKGFWLSINRAPPDVRKVAKFVGRLQVCLITADGKPGLLKRGGNTIELESPFVANCTAALLPENRLLTNNHCYYDPDLVKAGFTHVQEARINFNYTSADDTGAVQTYRVLPQEISKDEKLDALLLQVAGDANSYLGGHIPMKMMAQTVPFQELRLIHHPGAEPQQYSAGTCQVHRRQSEIEAKRSPFRHTCESMGGSSGSLLFDARNLAVVALHNQGGLSRVGDSFNGGHKIGLINEAFGLGFEEISMEGPSQKLDPAVLAVQALTAALTLVDADQKIKALRQIEADFPNSSAAMTARTVLAALVPPAQSNPVVTAATPEPKPTTAIVTATKPVTPALGLKEQMANDADVQNCDRLSGVSDHLDRGKGLMTQVGVPFAEIDAPRAIQACQAALKTFPNHPRMLSFLGRAYYKSGDFALTNKALENAARLGDMIAQHNLAYQYEAGDGIAQSYQRAAEWYEKAAKQGFLYSQQSLGHLYETGRGVHLSKEKALSWYRKAADQGSSDAEFAIGEAYRLGEGTTQSYGVALVWYRKAANQGHESAKNYVSELEAILARADTNNLPARDPIQVGFVYVSPIGENGWTYEHDQGRLAVEAAFGNGVETSYVESVPEGPAAEQVMTQMAESGVDLIFTTSFGYMDHVMNVATKFPDVKFEHATGYKTAPNVSVYAPRLYEGRAVQGLIAGRMTKTNVVGYIGSFPIPEVIRGVNAAYIQAKKVNPNVKFIVTWAYTWFDPAAEGEAARDLIAQGADVILQHTDSTEPLVIAENVGAIGFGQTYDMTEFANGPRVSSLINNWAPYYVARTQAVIDGTWASTDTWGGIDTGMVKIGAMTHRIPPSVQAEATALMASIKNGSYKPFTGPLKQQNGSVWLRRGETADDNTLAGLNFFVEGVKGVIE